MRERAWDKSVMEKGESDNKLEMGLLVGVEVVSLSLPSVLLPRGPAMQTPAHHNY